MLKVRHVGEKFVERGENEWPLARTKWTKFYLNPAQMCLDSAPLDTDQTITYGGFSDGVTFMLPPFDEETEITGPMASKLFVSSETQDADLFLVLRLFTPDMKEITFQGTLDPNTPIAQGWLRASHRKLVPELSTEWKPYQAHDEKQYLNPGEIYELDIEVWPTCNRGAARLPARAQRARQGLRIQLRHHAQALEHEERVSGLRTVFA